MYTVEVFLSFFLLECGLGWKGRKGGNSGDRNGIDMVGWRWDGYVYGGAEVMTEGRVYGMWWF